MVKTLPPKAGGVGLIPGWGVKIPHAPWLKKTQYETEAIGQQIQQILWPPDEKN